MYLTCFEVSAIHPSMPDELLIQLNQAQVEALALINEVLLEWYDIPSIYELKPRYFNDKVERWRDIGGVLKDMKGNCKDLTAWRLAELRKRGVGCHAESIVERLSKRKLRFHTYVRLDNGGFEDPAKRLGMP